jgi:uncharacterized membrane protein
MFDAPLHGYIVYVPTVLAIASLGFDMWAESSGNEGFHETGSRLQKWAALAAILAVATGFSLAGASGAGSRGIVTGHAGAGSAATLVLAASALVRYSVENREDPPESGYSGGVFAVQVLGALLIVLTVAVGFRI